MELNIIFLYKNTGTNLLDITKLSQTTNYN